MSVRLWVLVSLAEIGALFRESGAHGAEWALVCAQIAAVPALLGVAYAVFLPKRSFRVAALSMVIALLVALPIQGFRRSVFENGLQIGNESIYISSGVVSSDIPEPVRCGWRRRVRAEG
jgi:hypothetical protein